MTELWLSLKDAPPAGLTFELDDQTFWTERFAEFGVDCRIEEPLVSSLRASPQKDGAFLSGRIAGRVALACDRCTGVVDHAVDAEFEMFEPAPPDPLADENEGCCDEIEAQDSLLRRESEHLELDAGRLLWEQFVLSLPAKVLCDFACKGLCPRCGANLNLEECGCVEDEGDPRMAVFKNIKLDQ